MLRLAFVALLAAGCYNPKLGNPGFYCHEDDNPPCPDGQQCVNGQCQNPGGNHLSFKDMSTPGGGGDGGTDNGPIDMAHSSSPHDLSTVPATHDLSQLPNTMTGCLGLLMCENNCPATDMTCPTTCQNNATPQGNSLFQSLLNCVVQACPGSVQGDPCYNTSSTACSNCLNQAQMTGGACETQVSACDNNTP